MIPRDLRGQRLAALALLGWLLLTHPLLSIFDRPVLVVSVPALYLWIFGVWLLLIAVIALSMESGQGTAGGGR